MVDQHLVLAGCKQTTRMGLKFKSTSPLPMFGLLVPGKHQTSTYVVVDIDPPLLVNDRGFPWVEISYPYPYPQKPLPLARGTGFPGVRGRVFVIWGGGEHHHGTCNSHPPGYSFGESIL